MSERSRIAIAFRRKLFPSRIWCGSILLRLSFWDGLEPFDLNEEMSIFWSLMHISQLTPTKHRTNNIAIEFGLGYTMYCHRLPTDVFPFSAWMPTVESDVKARPALVQLSQQLKTTMAASCGNFFLHTTWLLSTLFSQLDTYYGNSSRIDYVCLPQASRVESCKVLFAASKRLQIIPAAGKRDHMPVQCGLSSRRSAFPLQHMKLIDCILQKQAHGCVVDFPVYKQNHSNANQTKCGASGVFGAETSIVGCDIPQRKCFHPCPDQ